MTDQVQEEDFDSIERNTPAELSAKELHNKRFQPRANYQNASKTPKRLQTSKPPKNSVKIKPIKTPVHFKWALFLTIFCFFLVGPCWALYKTIQLRRMIQRQENDAADRLSHKITTVLVVSTILGIFAWVAILFCTVGLLLTGELLAKEAI
ncbi:unnamed protein product [Adineta steineri]|uniref:Uncharacterized protein n=2 Tax=Adineta steineri TaxID=433720 RepID=A0A818S6Y0_9BILA|nr:unnamed protein product [Adineta steineri]CAF3665205.1 unnamed protein product [Adineta steineri]